MIQYPSLIKLIKYINERRHTTPKNEKYVLNFSKVKAFYKPYHVTSLACLIEENYLKEREIVLIPANGLLNNYFNNIQFYNYWTRGFNRSDYNRTKTPTTLCLWKISESMIDPYINYAQKYFETNWMRDKNLDFLGIALAEVFNNIFNHSKSIVDGYSMAQFYPAKNKIEISVCDFGIGIPKSINDYWEKEKGKRLSDADAIRASLIKRVSAKSTPRNRGFGLNTISTLVRELRGELTICSNNGLLLQYSNGYIRAENISEYFPGTLIYIEFDTTRIGEKEEELEDLDFIF